MIVDDQIKADWHESYVRDLFEMSGYQVTPNPLISGKTPDLLVTGAGIPGCIVECKVVERETGHEGIEHGCSVSMDSSEAFRRLYSKVEEKVAKYRDILEGRAYVVAVYDEGCFQNMGIECVAYGGWVQRLRLEKDTGKLVGRGWTNEWGEDVPGLLRQGEYRHCSGILYSTEFDHTFFPNAQPDVPVPSSVFSFARTADLVLTPNGISITSEPAPEEMQRFLKIPPWYRELRQPTPAPPSG